MRRTIRHTTLALAALTLVLAGCGSQSDSGKGGDGTHVSSSPTPTGTRPSSPTTSPTGCTQASTLGAKDSGRSVCLAVGDTVRVTLDGTAERPWKPLSADGSGLEPTNSGIVLQRGDASAAFKAVSTGKTRLTSTRPLCAAQTGRVSCLGIQEWWVTVVVR
ncbi:hypothetical protein OG895_27055 [Streptomyces sp. NBC_00201]|uniref:hypothetical protein n=1 Tax=unclassified Streptomyces TaxID=2593676 RepID=UPI002250C22E|nr:MULTISPECIES: hypothetical protein [unclassified Streptomyces]MCX5050928.1 hypothetical protein [Streptomyces sp. NBC_00474]MCX5061302.1 hypothetical protein [Streptomyces sp. NBC_00452]MCX5248835.1 hypothetical protein [Streptomyces sp. NBC_00201]